MTDLIGLYGIVVDPIEGVSIRHLPNGRAILNELYWMKHQKEFLKS